jgi:hypothetical protein
MHVSSLISDFETFTCMGVGLFLLWLGRSLWGHARLTDASTGGHAFLPSLMAAAAPCAMGLGFLCIGGVSIAYPFDAHGLIHPPNASIGAALLTVGFLLASMGVPLLALAGALAAHSLRIVHHTVGDSPTGDDQEI